MASKYNLIVLSKKSGQRYSFQISSALRVSLLLLILIIASVFFFSFSGISVQNSQRLALLDHIVDLETRQHELLRNKQEADLYRQWSENIIFKRFNFSDVGGRGSSVIPEGRLEGEIACDYTRGSRLVDVENFNVNRINLALDFDCYFDIVNRQAGRTTVSGYFFLLARNDQVIPEIYSLWPAGVIKSGEPGDYTQGDSFSIRYMKKIKARVTQPEIGQKYNRVDLIAYSDNGELLMNKGYYIEKSLIEFPLE